MKTALTLIVLFFTTSSLFASSPKAKFSLLAPTSVMVLTAAEEFYRNMSTFEEARYKLHEASLVVTKHKTTTASMDPTMVMFGMANSFRSRLENSRNRFEESAKTEADFNRFALEFYLLKPYYSHYAELAIESLCKDLDEGLARIASLTPEEKKKIVDTRETRFNSGDLVMKELEKLSRSSGNGLFLLTNSTKGTFGDLAE
jgi:hypothetical protein